MARIAEAFGFACTPGRPVGAWSGPAGSGGPRFSAATRWWPSLHVDTGTGAAAPLRGVRRGPEGPRLDLDRRRRLRDGRDRGADGRFGHRCRFSPPPPKGVSGAPPGLAVDVFSPRAAAKRRSLPSIPAYYTDLLNSAGRHEGSPDISRPRRQRNPGVRRGGPDRRRGGAARRFLRHERDGPGRPGGAWRSWGSGCSRNGNSWLPPCRSSAIPTASMTPRSGSKVPGRRLRRGPVGWPKRPTGYSDGSTWET